MTLVVIKVYHTKEIVLGNFLLSQVFSLAQLPQTFSQRAGRLSAQSIIRLLLPVLVCSENTLKPQSSKIDFQSQVVFTFEIV